MDNCFYCGALVSKRKGLEMDHFPVPARNGGKDVVPACISCHDMKDRHTLGNWPIEWTVAIINDFPKMSRETRIFLAKAMSLCSDASAQLKKAEKTR